MNYYLLFFGLYAAGLFPVVVRIDLRLSKDFASRFRLGLPSLRMGKKNPFGRRKNGEEMGDIRDVGDMEEGQDVVQSLLRINTALMKTLFSRQMLRMVKNAMIQGKIWLFARCAFQDAAATALWYAAFNLIWETLRHRKPRFLETHVHSEISFEGEGSLLAFRGIFMLRLGSLALMAARIAAVYQQKKTRGKIASKLFLKEGQYAASHR